MPQPLDSLGPILDLVSWVGFGPGIPLLIAGWVSSKRRCRWARTTAEVFEAGGFTGLRWIDGGNAPHLSLHTAEQLHGFQPGDQILVHYDCCHPSRWSIERPGNENPLLVLGGILTTVGILSATTGFILMMF